MQSTDDFMLASSLLNRDVSDQEVIYTIIVIHIPILQLIRRNARQPNEYTVLVLDL